MRRAKAVLSPARARRAMRGDGSPVLRAVGRAALPFRAFRHIFFVGAALTGADFSGADVQDARLGKAFVWNGTANSQVGTGITLAVLLLFKAAA